MLPGLIDGCDLNLFAAVFKHLESDAGREKYSVTGTFYFMFFLPVKTLALFVPNYNYTKCREKF